MPVAIPEPIDDPSLLHFTPVGPSKDPLDYADLQTVDMSTFHSGPAAQAALAQTVRSAMHHQGFFVLTNFGISEAEIERQVDIAYTLLQKTPFDEKKRLEGSMQATGSYQGFKLRSYYEFGNGVKDKIEQWNYSRNFDQEIPSVLKPYFKQVRDFADKTHNLVLFNVLRLFAIALEVPSETLVDAHKFHVHDEAFMRYMAYYDEHSEDDMKKMKNVWLKGHTDFGTVTILYSQPMSSLQVRNEDGRWQYVRHVPGAIIVNCGAEMEFYTGGYFKAAQHRVHQPPDDQRGHTRMGVFYFAHPNDDERPNTLMQSPVLQAAGVKQFFPGEAPTAKAYAQARIKGVGKSDTYKKVWGEGEVVVEVIDGVEVPWYG